MITQWNQSHEENPFHSPIIEVIDLYFILDAARVSFGEGGGGGSGGSKLYSYYAFDIAHVAHIILGIYGSYKYVFKSPYGEAKPPLLPHTLGCPGLHVNIQLVLRYK